jgi:hypothetical protein
MSRFFRYLNKHRLMHYKKTILTCLLLWASVAANAQYAKGPQKLLDSPSGEPILDVRDSTRFFAFPENSGWLKLSGVFLVNLTALNEGDSSLAAGADLLTLDLSIQGKTLKDVKVLEWQTLKGKKFRDYRQVRIEGWLYHNRVHADDVPEYVVKNFIEKGRGNLTDLLIDQTDRFKLEKREFDDYTAWVFRAIRGELHANPEFQYIVVTRGGVPFCVISRHQRLELSKEKDQRSEGNIFYTYLQKPNPKAAEMVRDIAYAYIRL